MKIVVIGIHKVVSINDYTLPIFSIVCYNFIIMPARVALAAKTSFPIKESKLLLLPQCLCMLVHNIMVLNTVNSA